MCRKLPLLFVICLSLAHFALAAQTDTVRLTVTSCDGIVWFGEAYSHDTVAEHLIAHEDAPDTVYILTLFVNHTVHTDIYDTTCGPYEYLGQTYTESGDYEVERFSRPNGCDSVVVLHLSFVQPPPAHAIIGDTLVCRGQRATFFYPNDYPPEAYWYLWYFEPSTPMGTNVSSIVWDVSENSPSTVTVGMMVVDRQHECIVLSTSLVVHVCDEQSPAGARIVRKSDSDILICENVEDPAGIVHYRWGLTDRQTFEETAYDWDLNYYQYDSPINTDAFLYWVETYLVHDDVVCRNRTFYAQPESVCGGAREAFDVMACLQGGRLLIQADNPSADRMAATLYDMGGRAVARWDLGSETAVRKQLPFPYPAGAYILTVQAGARRHTTKIFCRR